MPENQKRTETEDELNRRVKEELKTEYKYISCCGKYYCALCAYFKGSMVEAAKNLLGYAERYGSLRLISDRASACNFDEFMKGLEWLASQEKPCRGCRFGGGWSWWPDCPTRDCVLQKGIDFCYQCADFPCRRLQEEPFLERKKESVEANYQIGKIGIEKHLKELKEKYKRAAVAQAQKSRA